MPVDRQTEPEPVRIKFVHDRTTRNFEVYRETATSFTSGDFYWGRDNFGRERPPEHLFLTVEFS